MPAPAWTPRDAPLLIGASWYPEMWPEDEWPRDVARMRELGFSAVRLFEFAWHRCEPAAGRYDFDWARRVMDLCHEAGLGVIVGTPTAAPPAWLTARYPEVLGTRADGRRRTHGQRKHYNHHSVRYRELAVGIAARFAAELGEHPALIAWQIDNEMSGFDYGAETAHAFHAWLERRFGSVDALNAAWGLEFWSQAYDRFDQVPLVTAAVGSVEIPERHHPSLVMAIAEFQNQAWTAFIQAQIDAIRTRSAAPIGTNMTGLVGAMAWDRHNRVLDRVGASMYADRAHYAFTLPRMDRLRAEKDAPWWLLETAPNWSAGGRTWNIHHDAAGVRLFTWLSAIQGAELVLYWQWREHWAGQEMLHGTCVTATGAWRPNREAWARLGTEFADQGRWLQAHPPARAGLGVVMSSRAAWAFSIDPTDEDMRYEQLLRDRIHLPLQRAGWYRDVLAETADLAPYRVVALPLLPVIDDALRARLRTFVEAGGTLILGPLSGTRSTRFTAFTDRAFGGLEDLIGGESALRFTVQWAEDEVALAFDDGHRARLRTLCEAFAPTGATVLARYAGGYGDGLPGVLDHRLGAGRVITLGGLVDEATWVRVVGMACRDAGLAPVLDRVPPEVVAVPRVDAAGRIAGYGLANLCGEARMVHLPGPGRELLGGRELDGDIQLDAWEPAIVVLERPVPAEAR